MNLQLHKHRIERVDFGDETNITDHVLFIQKKALCRVISNASGLSADAVICRPEEKVRITNILDIIEPRIKPAAHGNVFSGFLGPIQKMGNGIIKVLEGVSVMDVAAIPRVQEGLVDMGGPGARYSPFSQTHNIILCFDPKPGMAMAQFEQHIRLGGLSASLYLAKASMQIEPDNTERFELSPGDDGSKTQKNLKPVAYVYMLQSQGFLRETFLYGQSTRDLIAAVIHPNEIMAGAIVSGNYVIPANRNPTYIHLNNPVIRELYHRHLKDLFFTGVVICNEHSGLAKKKRVADKAVEILKGMGAVGAIITKEGGGNADTDLMLMCRACESQGIGTVLVGNEGAGVDGGDPSLTHITKEADAFITTGNSDELVKLGPVERVIGQGPLPGVKGDLKKGLTIPVGRINGATNPLGYSRLTVGSQ